MTSPSLTPRPERVPFSRAVVVTPLDEGKPELTLVGANLSKGGMFVKSKEMLEPGTKVSLSLEAKGQAFPFAEAEVVWERPMDEKATDSVIPGFGLRFVNFLHPRAPELVDTLLEKAAKKKQKEMEAKFAEAPEKFTELSIDEAPKAKEPKVEAAAEPEKLEAPPLPKRTKTDPEFVKSGESFVIDIQKERADGADEEEDAPTPPSAFKSQWPKLMGALAMAPLFLVPLGVAIGTWRASKAPEPHAAIEQAAAAQTETRTIEFAPPPVVEQAPKIVDPLAITPAPELMAEEQPAAVANAGKLDDIDPVPLVEEKPAAVVAPKPVAVEVTKLQARVEPKPRVEPKKSVSATLPLELAAVKSLSGSLNGNALELNLSGTSKVRRAFALKSPNRLVIDIGGQTPPKSAVHEFTKISGVQRVRVGALPDGVRLVLDLSKSAANVQVTGAKVSATLQ